MNQSYLNTLKEFVEGEKDLREWPAWWQENASLIEENEGRTRYLKVKLYWREGACQILDRHAIPYHMNETLNWSRCTECGEPLFAVVPHQTTQAEIIEFARTANFLDVEQIERDPWMHPGVFCPNGCTAVLMTYRDDPE